MHKKKLCSNCKMGRDTYNLDRNSPMCPYLRCHNGKECTMFEMLEKPKKKGFFGRLFGDKIKFFKGNKKN